MLNSIFRSFPCFGLEPFNCLSFGGWKCSCSLSLAHLQRLSIAEALGDKMAARRAYSNLGNAQVFLGKYSSATQYYL